MSLKVYGYSDDNVVVEGTKTPHDETGCFDSDVLLTFTDGTVIRAGYPKKEAAIWWIEVEKKGTAAQKLTECDDEDADIYSDIFEIDAEVASCEVVEQKYTEETDRDKWSTPKPVATEEQRCICVMYDLLIQTAKNAQTDVGQLSVREKVDAALDEYAELIQRAQRLVSFNDELRKKVAG